MAGHILIIEDDERLAAMVSDYLGEAGFRVNHHANAGDGLAALKRTRFDALILDVTLPDVDGFDVCRPARICRACSRSSGPESSRRRKLRR